MFVRCRPLCVVVMMMVLPVFGTQAHGGEAETLAPTGPLRVGVYPGSPLSMVKDQRTGEARGISYDLGAQFAARLSVKVGYMTYQRIADVLDAMKNGKVDFTVSNATAARARDVDFSGTLLSLELGFLVPPRSVIDRAEDVDRAQTRVGVTKGSTSETTLPARLTKASVVAVENLKVAIAMLSQGELDAFATNKPTLFQMSDEMPGSRVLDGNWGLEHVAIAIPKGREQALAAVNEFVAGVRSDGSLWQAAVRAGLRGVVDPDQMAGER